MKDNKHIDSLELHNIHAEPEVRDLIKTHIAHPRLQTYRAVSPRETAGQLNLAFYRGRQVGIHDVYLALVNEHPRIANKILKLFSMNKEGNIGR